MKARDVRLSGSRIDGFLVHVPCDRDSTLECVLDIEDWNFLVEHKVKNLYMKGGQVCAFVNGVEVLVSRVVTDAMPGQRVVYMNDDNLDLRRCNLGLSVSGGRLGSRHDRTELVEAYDRLMIKKARALERGYRPPFRKHEIIYRPVKPQRKRIVREPLPIEVVA